MEDRNVSLYCVPTPIGNLSDMSPRALEVLKTVDFIAAEDTRNSGVMLKYFDIKKPMVSYFEHNKKERGEVILSRLLKGETCALITDAGTPAISDPGEELVKQVLDAGLKVSSLPGPCALTTALSMSGMSTKRFTFEGFVSTARNNREKHLSSLEDEKRTMIFYEAPHHLVKTLEAMYLHFGDRKISLVREISKIYEETIRTTLSKALEFYSAPDRIIKGEFVLIIEGKPEDEVEKIDENTLFEEFQNLIKSGENKSSASKILAEKHSMKKRDIYEMFKENKS